MKFFEFLALYNYCEGLMFFTAVFAFIFSLRHYGRHRGLRIIPYYFGFFLLGIAVQFIWYSSTRGDRFAINLYNIFSAAFAVFEFDVFSVLILYYIAGTGRRMAIKLNTVIFSIAEIVLFFLLFPRNPMYRMCLLQGMGLVLPCGVYFYELFTTMNPMALRDRPSFWIVTGIIYQSVCGLSLMLSRLYLGRWPTGAYVIGTLFYSILFVLFIRAYKCSPREWAAAQNPTGEIL